MATLRKGDLVDGQFRVVRSLGRGGMGSVYLATYLDSCQVALKLVGDPPAGTSVTEFDLRFIRECRILMELRHPAIVSAYTHGITEAGLRYLVMEFVPGSTLDAVRTHNGAPLSAKQCASLLIPIADALFYCHQKAVTHRDLSPQNMLCNLPGSAALPQSKIVDFGAGWRHDARQLTSEVVFANVDFQPLERFASTAREDPLGVGVRADIYALAAVAYFLTAGPGRAGAVLSMQQKAGHAPLDAVADPAWAALLGRALHRDPEQRPQSMGAFVTAMREFVPEPTIPAVAFWEREAETRHTALPRGRSPAEAPWQDDDRDPDTRPSAAEEPAARPLSPLGLAAAVGIVLVAVGGLVWFLLR